jgi:hypothetical protein
MVLYLGGIITTFLATNLSHSSSQSQRWGFPNPSKNISPNQEKNNNFLIQDI